MFVKNVDPGCFPGIFAGNVDNFIACPFGKVAYNENPVFNVPEVFLYRTDGIS
jgi:hypothetical protein